MAHSLSKSFAETQVCSKTSPSIVTVQYIFTALAVLAEMSCTVSTPMSFLLSIFGSTFAASVSSASLPIRILLFTAFSDRIAKLCLRFLTKAPFLFSMTSLSDSLLPSDSHSSKSDSVGSKAIVVSSSGTYVSFINKLPVDVSVRGRLKADNLRSVRTVRGIWQLPRGSSLSTSSSNTLKSKTCASLSCTKISNFSFQRGLSVLLMTFVLTSFSPNLITTYGSLSPMMSAFLKLSAPIISI
mmetsp:Transcript_3430/g.5337  ORF Transcript_3430/g.5337 Transcript_3430/m.5337 type:complete len:241 (-) Transcript_3430:1392-2114(-)